jgi:hypothetical protein
MGTWGFCLRNAGGSSWSGSVADSASGVTATLDALSVSPTMVIGHLVFTREPLLVTSDQWTPRGTLIHGADRLALETTFGKDNAVTFTARQGIDDWKGSWRIRIDEVSADPTPSKRIRITGPWVLDVTVSRRRVTGSSAAAVRHRGAPSLSGRHVGAPPRA